MAFMVRGQVGSQASLGLSCYMHGVRGGDVGVWEGLMVKGLDRKISDGRNGRK